jgi:hypothetical protein
MLFFSVHFPLGDALFSLGKHADAYNAYNAGLRIDSKDRVLIQKCDQVMASMRGAAEKVTTQTSREDNLYPSNNARGSVLCALIRQVVMISCLFSFIPFFGLQLIFYRVFYVSAIGLYMIGIYLKHGLPQFTIEEVKLFYRDVLMVSVFLPRYLMFNFFLLSDVINNYLLIL